jgi:hypothetical protein
MAKKVDKKNLQNLLAGCVSSIEIHCTKCEVGEISYVTDSPVRFAMMIMNKGWTATEEEVLCAKCSGFMSK